MFEAASAIKATLHTAFYSHLCWHDRMILLSKTTLKLTTAMQLSIIHSKKKDRSTPSLAAWKSFALVHFSKVFHFIKKPAIWFAMQINRLVSIWNAKLDWNGLITTNLRALVTLNFIAWYVPIFIFLRQEKILTKLNSSANY